MLEIKNFLGCKINFRKKYNAFRFIADSHENMMFSIDFFKELIKYLCPENNNGKMGNLVFGKIMIGLEYLLKRSGPMSMAPSQLGAFAYSSPEQKSANVEYHVQPLSLERFGEDLHSFNAFTASVCNLRPTSRGSVHIASTDPEAPPIINPNYLSTDEDRKVLRKAVMEMNDSMTRAGAEREMQKEITNDIADKLGIDKNLFKRMSRAYFRANFKDEVQQNTDFEEFYTNVMEKTAS